MVRSWLETTVTAIQSAVARWFDDLRIIDAADGKIERCDFKLWSLLATLVPQKDGKPDFAKLPPQLGNELMHAALSSSPIPRTILAAALRRQSLDRRKPDDTRDPRLNPARLGLIRAVLNRLPNQNITMTAQLDPACSDPAYLCGRLFAVFAELQPIALESVNAGVVERFYASASVTPSLVMGRLFRNAQNHLSKADGRGGWRAGAAENLRRDFEQISTALGCEFPPTLSLEAQGRFALGFYHQKADYRRQGEERANAIAAREAAATASA
jgi:CRISPR-associated protein Csd1